MQEGAVTRSLYLPPSSRWFSVSRLFSAGEWSESEGGGRQEVAAPLDLVPLHLRGGHILPLQQPALNTSHSRANPLELLAALDDDIAGLGSIFLDDGESVNTVEEGKFLQAEMEIKDNVLSMSVIHDGLGNQTSAGLYFERIVVLGFRREITAITVNGEDYTDWTFSDGGLFINNLSLQVNEDFSVVFV